MRLHDYLVYHAGRHPAAPFAIEAGRTLTYGEAGAEVNRIANAFIRAGFATGERVALLGKNSARYALLYYAASLAGVVLVPLNYRLAPAEWSFIVNDAEAGALLFADEYAAAVDSIRTALPRVRRFVALDGSASGWESLEQFVAGCPETAPERLVSPENDVYQMYTSGTTGRPKGTVLTHAAVTANIEQIVVGIGQSSRLAPGDRCLTVAPLYHAASAITTFVAVYSGACLYIMPDFAPAEVVRVLSEERIVGTVLVPAMIQACLIAVPDAAQRTYGDLRSITYGASPIAEQTLRRAAEVFKCDFAQGYGMTETTAALSLLTAEDHARALAGEPKLLLSAGRPLVGTDVCIVDADDRSLPPGAIGEIVGRGPQLMRAYWNLPDETRQALRGGWMHTGDAGTMDEEGFIYIQDRVKDMIVSGGENVYPREVEDVLFEHAAVADAAVFGVPHERWGETVRAAVVLRQDASISAEELIAFSRGKLAGFKLPTAIDFVPALPRNPSGKVLKRELREPFWTGQSRRVAGA